MPHVIVAPSILAANIGDLAREVKSIEAAGADWLHVDIMDGSFVPSITFGDNVVRCLKANSKLFLDTHLMIQNPERHLEAFVKAGADRLTVHVETCPHLYRTLTHIRSLGIKNGVSMNPGTPVEAVFDVLEVCDLVLVMTVNPGWGGQPFLPSSVPRIARVAAAISERQLPAIIQVDGGINPDTAKLCVRAGASSLVAGTALFGAPDRKAAIDALRG